MPEETQEEPAEEAPKEETPKEPEAEDSGETPADNPLQEAKEVLSRMEKANKENKEILERMEKLKAEEIMGGKSRAGQTTAPKKDPEVEQKERINKILENTGMRI